MKRPITAEALAARWGYSVGHLANERSRGRSPVRFAKVAGRILYDLDDVEAYEDSRMVPAGVAR